VTSAELIRMTRDIVPPVGATMAVAVVDHEPGGKLVNGAPSGQGGRTRHGVAWLVNGRTQTAPIALFGRPRDALALLRVLKGEAPRGPLAPTTPVDERQAVPDPASPGAPGPVPGAPSTAGDVCAGCGCPIPPGRRGQRRRSCSVACRRAASRRVAAEADRPDADGAGRLVTPSRPFSTDPASLRAPDGGSSARPELGRPPNPAAAPMPGQRVDDQLALLLGV